MMTPRLVLAPSIPNGPESWSTMVAATAAILLSSASALSADWPEGPNYSSEGPFHVWTSIPNERHLDLGKLAGVTEVSQVYINRSGWVVLFPDGSTASRFGGANKSGVFRICPGTNVNFALLRQDSGMFAFGKGGEIDEATLPKEVRENRLKDAYLDDLWGAAITEDGAFHVWGKSFDGVEAPEDEEWTLKPSIPEGRRAVRLSGTYLALTVQTDDGKLHSWARRRGDMGMPVDFKTPLEGDFVQGAHYMTALKSRGDSKLIQWDFRKPEQPVVEIPMGDPIEDLVQAGEGIVALTENGTIKFAGVFQEFPQGIRGTTNRVSASSCDAISIYRGRGKEKADRRLLWFEGEVTPVIPPVEAEVTSTAPEIPTMPAASDTPAVEASALVAVPELPAIRTRVAGYQKARSDRLSKITNRYVTALKQAENLAQANGELDKLVRVREGLKNAKELQLHLELLTGSTGIAPVGLPPALTPPVDLPVQQERKKFDSAFSNAERELATALDQSLNFVQQNQVKNRKLELAKATRELREEVSRRFAEAFPKKEEKAVATAPTQPTVLEKALATTNQPASKPTTKPGRLKVWSSQRDDDAVRITRARGFDDLVQVYLYQSGWVVLRENGEAVGSNRDHDRPGVSRITKGWDNAFGMITEDGELLYFGPGKGKPPGRVRNVRDAFVCETQSIALHQDGTITTWGPAYKTGDLDGQKWVPAPTGLTNIDRVMGSPWLALAITTDGMSTAWRATGPCRMGSGAKVNVRDISAKGKGIRFINENGGMLWWRMSDSGANGYPDWKDRYGDLKSLPETQEANFARLKDGSIMTDLKWIERYPELREALEENKDSPEEAFSFWSGPGPHRFAWIESK